MEGNKSVNKTLLCDRKNLERNEKYFQIKTGEGLSVLMEEYSSIRLWRSQMG